MQGVLFRPGDERFEGKARRGAVKAALADPSCLMVNRNAGAGTRVLIDQLLARRAAARLRQPAALAQRRRRRGGAGARRLGRRDRAGGADVRARLPAARARALRFPAGGEPARAAGGAGVSRGAARPPHQRTGSRRWVCNRPMTRIALTLVLRCCSSRPAQAQLRGHGGPVRALGVSADGKHRGVRQLRHLGDPLVADAQCRRAGAALPRERGERGRARCRTAASSPAARTARSRSGSRARRTPERVLEGHVGADRQRSRCRRTARRSPPRPGIAPSGCGRSAGGEPRVLRRPSAERQRRGVHAGRQGAGQRGLRPDAAHLAARRRRADRRDAADAAQCGRGRPRWRDRRRRRRRPRVLLLAVRRAARRDRQRPDADHRRRRIGRRRARRRGRHPRLGRDHRPRDAQARCARWSAPGCRCGRRRSFPTTARCSPAAPTA